MGRLGRGTPALRGLLLLLGALLATLSVSGSAGEAEAQASLPDVTLYIDRISVTESADRTPVTITAIRRPGSDTTNEISVTLALGGSPLLTQGVRAAGSLDYTTTLDNSNNVITIAAGATEGASTFEIIPEWDFRREGDEAIVVTGSATGMTVSPIDLIIEDGPYTAFPKYIYGDLYYPGAAVSFTVPGVYTFTTDAGPTYALTKTEPSNTPLRLTFNPTTRELTGTAPAAADVPDAGLTARYTITATEPGGFRGTVMVSIAVVKEVCLSSNTTLFPADTHPTGQSAPPAELVKDCNVLLAAKDTLRGTGTLNWATNIDITKWDGLAQFHAADSRNIRKIELLGKSLNGTIPPVLGHLAAPSSMDLVLGDDYRATRDATKQNKLTGPIPPELGLPPNMIVLALSKNNLTGPIPRELANNGKINSLYISDIAGLTGSIPPELAEMKLRNLQMAGNGKLTGRIPWQLGKLAPEGAYRGLLALNLSSNSLTGRIPWQLGRFGNIQQLALSSNKLTGSIPWQLGNLSKDETRDLNFFLYLNRNQLSGPIPPQLGNYTKLKRLFLNDNRLTGAIPAELGNLSSLQLLWLQNNQLTGVIPSEFAGLTAISKRVSSGRVSFLRLEGNKLETPVTTFTLAPKGTQAGVTTDDDGVILIDEGAITDAKGQVAFTATITLDDPGTIFAGSFNASTLFRSNFVSSFNPKRDASVKLAILGSTVHLTLPHTGSAKTHTLDFKLILNDTTYRGDRSVTVRFSDDSYGAPGVANTRLTIAADAKLPVIRITEDDPRPASGGGGGGGVGGGPSVPPPEFAERPSATRTVSVSAQAGDAVGDPLKAKDPGGGTITYVLLRSDGAPVTVDPKTGQVKVKEGADLKEGDTFKVYLAARGPSGAMSVIDVTITVTGPQYHAYDTDKSGAIEQGEALAAVQDYFRERITLEEVLEILRLYFGES